MMLIGKVLKLCAAVALGVAASGCIVLPYGGGHHRRDRDDRDYVSPRGDAPVMRQMPRDGRGQ